MFSWTVLIMTLLKKRTYSLPNSLVPSQLLLIEYVIARTPSYCKGYLHRASPTSFGTRSRAAPNSALFLPPPCADSGLPPPLPPRRWPTAPAILPALIPPFATSDETPNRLPTRASQCPGGASPPRPTP